MYCFIPLYAKSASSARVFAASTDLLSVDGIYSKILAVRSFHEGERKGGISRDRGEGDKKAGGRKGGRGEDRSDRAVRCSGIAKRATNPLALSAIAGVIL